MDLCLRAFSRLRSTFADESHISEDNEVDGFFGTMFCATHPFLRIFDLWFDKFVYLNFFYNFVMFLPFDLYGLHFIFFRH